MANPAVRCRKRALPEPETRLGRERRAVAERDLDVVHLEVTAVDLDPYGVEETLPSADYDRVVIHGEAHPTGAERLPLGRSSSRYGTEPAANEPCHQKPPVVPSHLSPPFSSWP